MLITLAFSLLFVAIFIAYSHKISQSIIKNNIESASEKQLEFSIKQMERDIKQLETQNILLINDPSIKTYANSSGFLNDIDRLMQKKEIEEKISIQSSINKHKHTITIHWPQTEEIISTVTDRKYSHYFLINSPKSEWFLTNVDNNLTFHYLVFDPYIHKDLQDVFAIVETTFTTDYLSTILESVDASGNAQSFFYFQDNSTFSNHSVNQKLKTQLQDQITKQKNVVTSTIFDIDNEEYSVQIIDVPIINAKLISYIKLSEFLAPLNQIQFLVYITLVAVFITGLVMTFLLSRYFRSNIKHLISKIEQLGDGDYSSRVTINTSHINEFNYLFNQFNLMAQKIQSLIENVYEEKIRAREAEYKHLQSQINPHFLYNCLFFIVSMANKSPKAVISMAKNLANYYRYITKNNNVKTTFLAELEFIESYLKVQSLRNPRIQYSIEIDEAINQLMIPTLSIQPIIENAIEHGIDQKKGAGKINITGKVDSNKFKIIIEDDGIGLSSQELKQLNERLRGEINIQEEGYGLWNIHQRLIHQFGPKSGLVISNSNLGGLCVTVNLMTYEKNRTRLKRPTPE